MHLKKYIAPVFVLTVLAGGVLPSSARADVLPFMINDVPFTNLPSIPSAPFGTYQTALRAGNTPTFQVSVRSIYPDAPIVSADLSAFGIPASTTVAVDPAGASHHVVNFVDYYPSYHYDFTFTVPANISEGIKDIPVTATDLNDNISTTTAHIIVDNTPPAVSITSVTFSTTSPRQGDYMYLSGSVRDTGTMVKVSSIDEALLNASSTPFPGSVNGYVTSYDTQPLNAAIAASPTGTFTHVAVQLVEAVPGQIMSAAMFKVHISAYDEAGNVGQATASPVVTPPPPPPPSDITPPEIRVTFSTSTKALAFIATDTQGTTTVTTSAYTPSFSFGKFSLGPTKRVTARDAAGNTTSLIYTEIFPSVLRNTVMVQSVVYNGATTTLPLTGISYKWKTDKNGSYNIFATYVLSLPTFLETHYRPKTNQTIFMTKPQDLDDSASDDACDSRPKKQTLPGMVIPSLQTDKGTIKIVY